MSVVTSSTITNNQNDDFKKPKDVLLSHYRKGNFLGKGGFAKCYEFIHLETQEVLAAKIVEKASLKPKAKAKLATEIKIHKQLRHKNIVQFERFFEDRENVYILLEKCDGNTMMEYMKEKKRLRDEEALFFFHQILDGVQYMHDNHVIHRDLKLGNLFLTKTLEIKIGDFGLATQVAFDGERKKTLCGTPNYIAPEILEDVGHSYEVDIWSLGIILYTMLVGIPPFETATVKTTYKKIKDIDYKIPADVSEDARDLISKILVGKPHLRPTLQDVRLHPFVQKYKPHQQAVGGEHQSTLCSSSSSSSSSHSNSPLVLAGNKNNKLPISVTAGSRSPLRTVINNVISTGSGTAIAAGNNVGGSLKRNLAAVITQGGESYCTATASDVPIALRTSPKKKQKLSNPSSSGGDDVENNNPVVIVDGGGTSAAVRYQLRGGAVTRAVVSSSTVGGAQEPVSNIISYPQQQRVNVKHWVTRWLDFTSKYGFAYLLNDGLVGAYFNDSTRMTWNTRDGSVEYYDRQVMQTLHIDGHAEDRGIRKKITLMMYFEQYLLGKLPPPLDCSPLCGFSEGQLQIDLPQVSRNASCINNKYADPTSVNTLGEQQPPQLPVRGWHVKRVVKTRHATLFRFNDLTLQVCFNDHVTLLLTNDTQYVTILTPCTTPQQQSESATTATTTNNNNNNNNATSGSLLLTGDVIVQTFPLDEARNQDIMNKIKYTKDILNQLNQR